MKSVLVLLSVILLVSVSACINSNHDPFSREFNGQSITFRGNLDEAEKVPIYTAEAAKNLIYNQSVERIRLAYVPLIINGTEKNGYFAVDSYELTYKLSVFNKAFRGKIIDIQSFPVNSSEEAASFASPLGPIIFMSGPSNQTAVTVKGNMIILEGKDWSNSSKGYIDLDLATDKLLLVLMEGY